MKIKGAQRGLFQYVFDSSALINIERNKKMATLRKRKGDILIPEKVAQEINQPNTPLSRFIVRYPEIIAEFKNDEGQEYLRVRSQIGIDDGEASAIAIAIRRKLSLVIDDKKGKLKAENHGVKTCGWRDFIR